MEMSPTYVTESDSRDWRLVLALALAAVLLFVWPIPHTISLRDLLLLACLGLFTVLVWRSVQRRPIPWHAVRVPLGLYLALSAWIVFVALAVSPETAWSFGEIKGQWLKATIALVVGGLLGAAIGRDEKILRLALVVIGGVLLLHVLSVIFEALSTWPEEKILATRVGGLTEGPDKSNYLTNMLFYLLLAEIVTRLVYQRRFLPLGNILLVMATALTLFAVYVEAVRNGIVELAIVSGLGVALVARAGDRRRRFIVAGMALALLVIVLALGSLSLRKDDRWQTFLETVPIALDIENKAWISRELPQPKLASGDNVDWSNYSRIARMRVGLSLIAEHPFGVGFGRNAFGHAVKQKYGMETSHSHSGIVDLGIGIGVPGMLLWIAFLGALLRLGYRGVRLNDRFPALVLLFLTAGYSFRMLVDSTIRDHMLQVFLFLSAFLAVTISVRHGHRDPARPPG